MASRGFIVACPQRTSADYHAEVLARQSMLRKYFVCTRRPTQGIPEALTCFNKAWGAVATLSAMALPPYLGEWVRSGMHPIYDAWVLPQIRPGDNIISSYGYANFCFKKVKRLGGYTFLDAGNSHPAHFWDIISEEHSIWGVKRPPYPRHWNQRALKMLESTDYIICPSRYVKQTYLDRGFESDRLLYAPFPTNLSLFTPDLEKAPPTTNPLWVVCTGSVSLRKGLPYLLEAVRLLRQERDVRLMLTRCIESSMSSILKNYSDIPIDWSPSLKHKELAIRLKKAHVFALLSLEDGFARTVTEALACGLPAVVTPHTGARDFIVEGENGYVVPIRDAVAAAEAIQKASNLRSNGLKSQTKLPDLSFEAFESQFMRELQRIGMVGN